MYFVLETMLRVSQLKRAYLEDPWNLFDFTLISMGVVDLYVIPHVVHTDSKGISGLRLLRMLRILRIVRVFNLFNSLNVILHAFVKAFSVVMWVGMLTLVFDYMVAIFATQVVGKSAHRWGEHEELVLSWFGSIDKSMQTLFIIMTLAEWDTIAMKLTEVFPGTVVFPCFIVYILIASYTMLSLITGSISECLISEQAKDETLKAQALEETRMALEMRLERVLNALDGDGDGSLDRHELELSLREHPEVFEQLALVDIHIDTTGILKIFDRLASDMHSEVVSVELLVEGLSCVTGTAKAADVFDLKHVIQVSQHEVKLLAGKVEEQTDLLNFLEREYITITEKLQVIMGEINRLAHEKEHRDQMVRNEKEHRDQVVRGRSSGAKKA